MRKVLQVENHSGTLTPLRAETWTSRISRRWNGQSVLRIGMLLLLLSTSLLLGAVRVSAHPHDGGEGNQDDLAGRASPAFVPTFQDTSCPFPLGTGIVEGQQVRCGYVTVPQNHAINNGKTVRLAVAIFKAPHYMHSVDPKPVLRLEGGPGDPSLGLFPPLITAKNYQTYIFNHNLIFFDQRGSGYSLPSLSCSVENTQHVNDTALSEQALRACYNRLVRQGIDLNNFNTLQNADDVADLIHALGYQQMTLYSVSYGTLLALTVMRLHPEVVHAVVLDSVMPPEAHVLSIDLPADAQRAFNVLFQRCAADPSCSVKYPNLKNVFSQVVDRLNATPHVILVNPTTKQPQRLLLTGRELVSELFKALYVKVLIPALPKIIYSLFKKSNAAQASLSSGADVGTNRSGGAYYSIVCSGEWPFVTQQDVLDSLKRGEPQITIPLGQTEQKAFDVCQFWKVKPVPIEQRLPVTSKLPALVLAGEYDPVTPPADGQDVASHLSHSYYFLFPGQSHGELYNSSCSNQIISEFEDHPYRRPNSSCIAHMTEPAFI